jgi:hypothetical protein
MRNIFVLILLFVISGNVYASNKASEFANRTEFAKKNGFRKCNTAINKEFDYFNKTLADARISISSLPDNTQIFSLMATYENNFIHSTFEIKNNKCYVSTINNIIFKHSCIKIKEETGWNFIDSLGNFTWTDNGRKVHAIFYPLPENGCSVFFNRGVFSYDADK